jgi:hypothetical protein
VRGVDGDSIETLSKNHGAEAAEASAAGLLPSSQLYSSATRLGHCASQARPARQTSVVHPPHQLEGHKQPVEVVTARQ